MGQRYYDPNYEAGLPVYRSFNNMRYKLGYMDTHHVFGTKTDAKKSAKAYRTRGYFVRIIPKTAGYVVYVRRKDAYGL